MSKIKEIISTRLYRLIALEWAIYIALGLLIPVESPTKTFTIACLIIAYQEAGVAIYKEKKKCHTVDM